MLHTALRATPTESVVVDGQDVTQVRSGAWRGCTDQPIAAVVNIGIGGSDLGPAMAYQWAVELDKALATRSHGQFGAAGELTHDSSAAGLIARYRRVRQKRGTRTLG